MPIPHNRNQRTIIRRSPITALGRRTPIRRAERNPSRISSLTLYRGTISVSLLSSTLASDLAKKSIKNTAEFFRRTAWKHLLREIQSTIPLKKIQRIVSRRSHVQLSKPAVFRQTHTAGIFGSSNNPRGEKSQCLSEDLSHCRCLLDSGAQTVTIKSLERDVRRRDVFIFENVLRKWIRYN